MMLICALMAPQTRFAAPAGSVRAYAYTPVPLTYLRVTPLRVKLQAGMAT